MRQTDPARTPVVVDGLRTPFGRYAGALREVRPDDMAAHVIRALLERTGVEAGAVDDVILGAANQAGEDNRNVGRMAALLAGMPIEVAGQTVNRLCGSGMQAVIAAAHAIVAYGTSSSRPVRACEGTAAFPRVSGQRATSLGWAYQPAPADAYP